MEIKNVEFSYGNHKVLNDISFKVQEGKITTIIGANGCGKSTLFNVITKNLKPQKGNVLLNGEDIKHISLKNFARQVAIVHQYNTAPNDITVEKLVSYGRIAHIDKGRRNYADDEKYINFAMEVTGVSEFAKKQISNLSGGQRQRVWIAMALAQNTKILLFILFRTKIPESILIFPLRAPWKKLARLTEKSWSSVKKTVYLETEPILLLCVQKK